MGQLVTGLEYENLVTALNLALEAQVSVDNTYFTLSVYLDAMQDQRRGLELGQTVLVSLEDYPLDKLAGQLGVDFVGVIDNIAMRQLALKQYTEAEASYQKALAVWLENKSYDSDTIKRRSASIYHQLGRVAQEQRQWQQAEQYYQQALQINIEYNDRYAQASTYHQLGRVAEEQRQWEQAEQYYQQALQIYIEYNDRYAQAGTYGQLGLLEQERLQWSQACDYLLRALEIFIAFEDDHYIGITIRNLARLWKASDDASLPAVIATTLGASVEETEKLLREVLGEK